MAVSPPTRPLPFLGHKNLKVLTGGGLTQPFPNIPCDVVWPDRFRLPGDQHLCLPVGSAPSTTQAHSGCSTSTG